MCIRDSTWAAQAPWGLALLSQAQPAAYGALLWAWPLSYRPSATTTSRLKNFDFYPACSLWRHSFHTTQSWNQIKSDLPEGHGSFAGDVHPESKILILEVVGYCYATVQHASKQSGPPHPLPQGGWRGEPTPLACMHGVWLCNTLDYHHVQQSHPF